MTRPIYLDYNATTPVDPQVVEAMLPCFTEHFGNPSSRTHAYGWAAAALVDDARRRVAAALGVQPEEVIFTSGATEANNLALKGTALAQAQRGRHIVTCATEHKAVLDPCRTLAAQGFSLTVLGVDRFGRVEPPQVVDALRDDTILVSLMLANNEIGTLHPVAEVAALCRQRGVLVHCDATQAVGKIPVNAAALGVDLLSLSAHKFYGPKGVGALVVRQRHRRGALVPLVEGGGHEQGLRSGTLNVPGIVGCARALELAVADCEGEAQRLHTLRNRLREGILGRLDGVVENGHPVERLPNTLSLSFEGVDGAALLVGLRELAVSPGSACTSADPRPSHVLEALGLPRHLAHATLRFSLGRPTTEEEVTAAVDIVVRHVQQLRRATGRR